MLTSKDDLLINSFDIIIVGEHKAEIEFSIPVELDTVNTDAGNYLSTR